MAASLARGVIEADAVVVGIIVLALIGGAVAFSVSRLRKKRAR